MSYRGALAVALLYMAAIEGVKVKVAVKVIDTYALDVFQVNVFVTVVFNTDSPCDNVQVFHDAIVEMDIEHAANILQSDDQGI